MAFNIQSFSTLSSSGNSQSVVLQDGTIIGSPGEYSYISASDTLATIQAADYFAPVAYILQVNSIIKATGSDLSTELAVATVSLGPPASVTTTVGGAAGGDVDGPASATDNAVALYDGTSGKLLQNSLITVSDVGVVGGITQLNVDNLRFDGNTVSTTNANGNLSLTPNGTGDVVVIGVTVSDANAVTGITSLTVDNLNFNGNTITSTDAGGNLILLPTTTGVIEIGANASHASALLFREDTDSGVNSLQISAPATLGSDFTYTLPSAYPTADGQALTATTAGVMSWSEAGSSFKLLSQVGHGFSVGDVLYLNSTTYTLAQADTAAAAEVVGIVISVPDADTFIMQFGGWVQGLAALTAGTIYYLSPSSAGDLTATKPTTATQVIKPLLIADSATSGYWVNQLGVLL